MSASNMAMAGTLPRETAGVRSTGWWGMVAFVVTEATLFGALISSYFYLRSGAIQWPPDGIEKPVLTLPLIMTVILLSSSIPMAAAEMSIKRGSQAGLRLGLFIAMVLGVLFLAFQVIEYSSKTFTPRTNVYGSLFFIITGFHMAHVIAGLIMLFFLFVWSAMGYFDRLRNAPVTIGAFYWHFVDVVWICVFFSLYVTPHLG
jgi:cytochrome c oxidase subunit 3